MQEQNDQNGEIKIMHDKSEPSQQTVTPTQQIISPTQQSDVSKQQIVTPADPPVQPVAPKQPEPIDTPDNIPETKFSFNTTDQFDETSNSVDSANIAASQADLSWSGPEFINHEKSANWHILMALAAVVLAAILYLITKDIIATATVFIAVIVLGVYGLRKPKDISYSLTDQDIFIGQNRLSYGDYRAFTAMQDGPYLSVTLLPFKRFALPAGLCCSGDQTDKVVNYLSQRLPIEEHQPDLIENLMQRIHF